MGFITIMDTSLYSISLESSELEKDIGKINNSINSVKAIEKFSTKINNDTTIASLNLINRTIESLMKISNIGVYNKPTNISLESINDKKTSIEITLEGIADTASKIWNAIIDTIKKGIDWVINLFKRIFGLGEKIKAKTESLKKEIKEDDIEYIAHFVEFENDALYKKLYCDKGIAEFKDYQYTYDVIDGLLITHKETIEMTNEVIKNIDDSNSGHDLVGKFIKDLKDSAKMKGDKEAAKNFNANPTDIFFITDPLIGNKRFFINAPVVENIEDSKKVARKYKSTIIGKIVTESKIKPKKIKSLAFQEWNEYLDLSTTIMTIHDRYKSEESSLNLKKKNILERLRRILNEKDKKGGFLRRNYKGEVKALLGVLSMYMTKLPTYALELAYHSANAINEYVRISKYEITEATKEHINMAIAKKQ